MVSVKDFDEKARAYALKNAIAHDGQTREGNVLSALFGEGLMKNEVKEVMAKITAIVSEVNLMSIPEQKEFYEKLERYVHHRSVREGLPELPDAVKGKVIMRFAPSASGPMHIGHAATGCTSALYVKKYGGKFYLRIEDTNPENITPEAYDMLADEAEWLFGKETEVIIQSDRMSLYYEYIQKMLELDVVYVCTCNPDKFKELIEKKKACPCRKKKAEQNIMEWQSMLDKDGFKEGEAVVRFKSDIKHKNPALREFPLARINETKHPRQGKKYRVWPLMNLAVAVDDMDLEMTHTIRAKDHRDNAERQKMIFSVFGKKYPWSAFLGRYKFTDMNISTTEMRKGIEEGKYSGWDDPKLPTIAALKKKGYRPEAFWGFSVRIGLGENDKVISKEEYFRLLDDFNRKDDVVY